MSPVAQLMVQLLVIVLLSRALTLALRAVGQPPVIAEILAGVALGPSLLGWLAPGAAAWLFPAATLPVLNALAQLGLVFFMFLVGLEFDPGLLQGRRHAAAVVSVASIAAPFTLGALLAVPLHPGLAPAGVPLSSFALFLGASMSITAFPVLARILGERRLLRTTVGALALACAAVNDVVAWCILAVVVAVVGAAGPASGLLTTVATGLYLAVMWLVVRPLLARAGPRAATELSPGLLTAAIAALLLSATFTELIGIHALFGGFALGAVMPRRGGLSAALIAKLEDFVTIVLLPLFFAISGLRAELGLLADAADWALCAGIIAVACAGKLGGSALAARAIGMSWRDAAGVGVLMNTRGLMELNIGLDLGVVSPKLFTMMVIMALVTTWMTSPLLARILRTPAVRAEAPPPGAVAPIVLCVSDPAIAPALVTLAAAFARAERQPLLALHIIPADRDSAVLDEAAAASAPLEAVQVRARELGVACNPVTFVSGEVAADIHRVAGENLASLTLLGVHRSVLGSGPLGGVVGQVVDGAPGPVGVLLDRGLARLERVVVIDQAGPASKLAERLRAGGAEVTALDPATTDPAALRDHARYADVVLLPLSGPHGLVPPDDAPGLAEAVSCSVLGVVDAR
jgi:Kef-type K+ transport system membrane component KefB